MKNLKLNVRGVVPAVVTPFDRNEEIDEALFRREIRYMLDVAHVHGITVTGTTGEGQTMSKEETRFLAETALDEVAGKVPVVSGVITNSVHQVNAYLDVLKDLPLAAFQITPVHYVFSPDEDGQVEFYKRIADNTNDIPIIIYNVIPWANLPVHTIGRIFDEVELVQGVKQSGKDIHKCAREVEELQMTGKGLIYTAIDDLLYSTFDLGCAGTISASPSVLPGLAVETWNAVQAGDHKKGLELHKKMLPTWTAVDYNDMPSRIKEAINQQGRPVGIPRSPFGECSPEAKKEIHEALKIAGVVD